MAPCLVGDGQKRVSFGQYRLKTLKVRGQSERGNDLPVTGVIKDATEADLVRANETRLTRGITSCQ